MGRFLHVITLEDAKKAVEAHWRPEPEVASESLGNVFGRVIAENITSKIDVPPFDRAAYDGYAVRASDTFGASEKTPRRLRLAGRLMAGGWPKSRLGGRTCIEIATGAPIPAGADAVEMVENTEVEKKLVVIKRPVAPGENVLRRGSDVQKGQVVVKRGKLLGPAELGVVAAAGVEKVKVFSKPKVAVISSGSELVTPGRKLAPGKVYDVNGWTLSAAVSSCGAEPIYLGIVPDRPFQIKSIIKKALKQSDAVLASGGSSAGAGDLIPNIVEKMGKPGLIFHGLAMKPGKPAFAAVIDGKPVFGLPGYPVSALMIFDQLAADYLRELSGISDRRRPTVGAKLTTKVVLARGRRELLPVKLVRRNKLVYAKPILKGSGAITSLLMADGYVDSPAEKEFIQEGELVHVKLFGGWDGD